jgi:pyruvate/2-oxoglutarate dehydrogenase complex dihydrolipoamide dehydrogenase (E3) component
MAKTIEILPNDEYNRDLVNNVHPSNWINPEPAPVYNLVVIGAGPAGLVTAAGAAGLGAKVALIERHLMGGDCLNVGCVPSKALLKSSRATHEVMQAKDYGINAEPPKPDFPAVMQRLRRIRASIAHHDSAQRFTDLGIDVFIGQGTFSSNNTIEVENRKLSFKKAVIATGARASIPAIEGLDKSGYLTNETIFELTELPKHLVILGAGPIGCELAQAFKRLGSEVTMIVRSRLSSREEPEASDLLTETLQSDGIDIKTNAQLTKVDANDNTTKLTIIQDGKESTLECDKLLVAIGRTPNADSLNLEVGNIQYDKKQGVKVNDRLQTTNPNVYAAGDICMKHKFTHAADAGARIAIQNTLFMGRKKISSLIIPRCTYTDPEIASVGITEKEATDSSLKYDVYKVNIDEIDRAQTDSETVGFIKVITARKSDKILGATIVSSHAGEMISEITTAMTSNIGLGTLANVIHPYPTQAEVIKRAADAYNRTRLSPAVKTLFTKFLAWSRR